MKNTCLLAHSSGFEGISYKRIQDTASLPVPLFFVALYRIPNYIKRYHIRNFLESNPTITGERFSSQIFIL